jgi:hypothetical protein
MLAAILFNAGGYDLFFQYMIYRSDSKIFARINNNHYKTSDLIEVKVPVSIPAQATQEYSDEYQPIGGQIEFKNKKYDYAEIKITRDTLYLRVVPNPELPKLVKASVLYGMLINDLPTSNTKHSNNPLTKKGLLECEYLTFNYNHAPGVLVEDVSDNFTASGILKPALEVGAQPPEISAILS